MADPIEVTVKRYRCPGVGCRRSLASKAAMVGHIGRCWYVPQNRTCKTCRHYEPEEDACGCEPGCNWGSGGMPVPEGCAAGVDITGGTPIVHCQRWEANDA